MQAYACISTGRKELLQTTLVSLDVYADKDLVCMLAHDSTLAGVACSGPKGQRGKFYTRCRRHARADLVPLYPKVSTRRMHSRPSPDRNASRSRSPSLGLCRPLPMGQASRLTADALTWSRPEDRRRHVDKAVSG